MNDVGYRSDAGRPTAVGRLYARLAVAPRQDLLHGRSRDLDAMRAVAALLVVANHAALVGDGNTPYSDQARGIPALMYHGAGAVGLTLFFALSGFLIAGPFLRALLDDRPAPEVRRYFWRRATRILPAYWVALTAAFWLIPPAGGVQWWQVPVHYTLTQDLVPGQSVAVLLVAWSLSIEAMFYVLVPAAAWLVRRLRARPITIDALARGVLVVWAATVVYGVAVAVVRPGPDRIHDVLATSLPGFLPCFLPGLLVYLAESDRAAGRGGAWAAYRRAVQHPQALLAAAVVVAVGGLLAYTTASPIVVDLGKHLVAIAAGMVLAVVCQGLDWMRRPAAMLAPLGLISYGIYLWHWIVVDVLLRDRDLIPFAGSGLDHYLVHLALVVAITIALATASWTLVERPFLRWHQSRRAAPAPMTAGTALD